MSTLPNEHEEYLKKKKKEKRIVLIFQILLLLSFLLLWEIAAHYEWINTFLSSSPSLVLKTFLSLFETAPSP